MALTSFLIKKRYVGLIMSPVVFFGIVVFFTNSIFAAGEDANATSTSQYGVMIEGVENDIGSGTIVTPPKEEKPKPLFDNLLEKTGDTTYLSEPLGYSFEIPHGWNVYQVPSMSYVRIETSDATRWDLLSDSERQNYFKIEVVVLSKNNLSLKNWIEQQNSLSVYTPPKVIEQREIEVDGYPAVYQIEELASGKIHPVVFIEREDKVYLLNIASSYEKHPGVSEEFIRNFKFSSH